MSSTNASASQETSKAASRRLIASAVAIALLAGASALTSIAQAQSAAGPVQQPADSTLTLKGITLSGIVDIGLQYQTHGAPISDYFPAGSGDLVQKTSNHSITGVTPNNLSQSRIGLQGIEPLGPEVGDWFGIFKLETFFNPQSGNISDALKSLVQNNGRAVTAQNNNIDSSVAGQIFQQALVGVSSKTYGALTFGRQNTLLADGVAKYDPNGAAQAFSLIGLSGTTAGGGDTEDRRLDDSLRYVEQVGPVHFGGQYKFSQAYGAANTAWQFYVGGEYQGLSVDAYYFHVRDAVAAGALSAAQVTALPGLGLSPSNALSGTISDNTTYSIFALYAMSAVKFYAGYEHIEFDNPKNPLAVGFDTIGGYKLGAVNNAAFPHAKTLQVYWAGAKYTLLKKLDLTGAYYGYKQNSYGVGANAGCSDTRAGTCAGTELVVSFDADYRWTKRFDTYIGTMYSSVSGGLASGYILANEPNGAPNAAYGYGHKAADLTTTAGFRFRF